MSIKVRIPTPLQKLTGNQVEVECTGEDIKDLVDNLEKEYPGIKARLYDENGSLRRFINFFVNDKDIRFLQGDRTQLKDGDEVSIIPAIAGGSSTPFCCGHSAELFGSELRAVGPLSRSPQSRLPFKRETNPFGLAQGQKVPSKVKGHLLEPERGNGSMNLPSRVESRDEVTESKEGLCII